MVNPMATRASETERFSHRTPVVTSSTNADHTDQGDGKTFRRFGPSLIRVPTR